MNINKQLIIQTQLRFNFKNQWFKEKSKIIQSIYLVHGIGRKTQSHRITGQKLERLKNNYGNFRKPIYSRGRSSKDFCTLI